ncbi:MAG: inositol monophosphatase [Paracoccaceae bacterium]
MSETSSSATQHSAPSAQSAQSTSSVPMTIAQNLTPAQQHSVINIVRRAARSEILPRYRNLAASDISQKSSAVDLVTIADRNAEAMITRGLSRAFANALIIGEEAVADTPALLDQLNEAELAFVIDPIDGTWNFTHGINVFGVIISATRFGQPIFGLLYDPIMDDYVITGADEDTRFVMGPNRHKICQTSRKEQAKHLRGVYHTGLMSAAQRAIIGEEFPKTGGISNFHCSCHEYRMLAQGHFDFVISVNPKPWDHLAGALAARRGGGVARMIDGTEYSAHTRKGILLVAGNETLWQQLAQRYRALAQT